MNLMIYFQGASIYISSLSLMGIALDRYKAVSLSYNKGSWQIPAWGFIFIIDITSILLIMPYSLHMKVNIRSNDVLVFKSYF